MIDKGLLILGEQLEEQANIILDCINENDERIEYFIDRLIETAQELKEEIK